ERSTHDRAADDRERAGPRAPGDDRPEEIKLHHDRHRPRRPETRSLPEQRRRHVRQEGRVPEELGPRHSQPGLEARRDEDVEEEGGVVERRDPSEARYVESAEPSRFVAVVEHDPRDEEAGEGETELDSGPTELDDLGPKLLGERLTRLDEAEV